MKLRRIAILAPALGAAACATAPGPVAGSCPTDPTASREAAEAVRSLFAALAKDDLAGVRAVTTDDFLAYEVGKRYTAATLVETIAAAHARGVRLQWNLDEVRAETQCGLSWAAWVNRGSSAAPGQEAKPRNWLESAVMEREDGRWRVRFLHSTPEDPRP